MRKRAFMLKVRHTPIRVSRKTIPLDRAKRLSHTLPNILAAIKSNNASTPRNKIDETLESSLHSRKIGVDIRVIEFDVRKNKRVRKVVQKLRPLVEKCGVILVAFEQKWPRLTHHKAGAEVLCNSPNEKRRRKNRVLPRSNFVDPGK